VQLRQRRFQSHDPAGQIHPQAPHQICLPKGARPLRQLVDIGQSGLRSVSDPALCLEPISGLEDPSHYHQACRQEHRGHGEAYADTNIGDPVETPAEAADQIDHGIEQCDRLPEGRQHIDGVETAAEKGQRRDDQERHELQLFEIVGPNANDEAEEAERHSRHPGDRAGYLGQPDRA
jgi:hypothetical protein